MIFGIDTVSALSALYMAAGLAACPSPQKVDVDVKMVVTEVPYVTNVTSQWLTDNFKNDPDSTMADEGKWMVGGLTKSNMNGKYQAQFYTHVNNQTGATCLAITSFTYTIEYSPVIYIASDFKSMGCRYSQTLAHEKRHVATDKRVIEKYLPDMKREITRLVKKMPAQGPYPREKVEEQQQRILQDVALVTKPYMDQLIALRRTEQAKIDTVENYKRDTALCPGQFPQFPDAK